MSIRGDISSYGSRLARNLPNASNDIRGLVDALEKLAKKVADAEERIEDLESRISNLE